MEPLLHNRKSTVVIEKKRNTLKKYDVALFCRPTGEYVLHRVIKVMDKAYLICGDNRVYKEYVPEEWVIGVMTGYFENESNYYVSCSGEEYRRYLKKLKVQYARLWLNSLFKRLERLINKMKIRNFHIL